MTIEEVRAAVEERLEPEPNSGCWLWVGADNGWGYGSFNRDRRRYAVHRLMYEAARGPIPPGLEIDHLCRVRSCANPAHMEPVTRRENQLRGRGFVASEARQTHCLHGHAFTDDNTYLRRDRLGRQCRACAARRARAYRGVA
jgi:hypothetical protein